MEKIIQTLPHIWQLIVTSNTFNFVIFVFCFVWLFKKINIKSIIATLQAKIVEVLDTATKTREEAHSDLKTAKKAVENLGVELETIVKEAEKSAEVIGEKLLTEAKKQAETIEANAEKVIKAEEKMIISKLSKKTTVASIEIAKNNVKKALEINPSLHEKYINESIDSLDSLNF